MAIKNLQEKFMHELGDIYDAENRFLKGQQEMLANATDPQLQQMLQQHATETQQQIANLDQVFSILGAKPKAVPCEAAKGLVKEAQEVMQEAKAETLRDCFIGGAATKVEHYEIASYRGLITGAEQMGQQQVVKLLQQNLGQEEKTAKMLEQSAPKLLQTAMQAEQQLAQ